jgi:5'-deoxynucleotidase YfbR-like HD superfamily hydrolase
MQTATGRHIDPTKPDNYKDDDIDIRDIAWSLSLTCRYNGHCKRMYSVAEHCCHLHDMATDEMKAIMLMHDATEIYLSDIPRPVKHEPEMKFYRELEAVWMKKIFARFRVSMSDNQEHLMHQLDSYILCFEARVLMDAVAADWPVIDERAKFEEAFKNMNVFIEKPDITLKDHHPSHWYNGFLLRFMDLEL